MSLHRLQICMMLRLLFLGGYEGPAIPNIDVRYAFAQQAYQILGGQSGSKSMKWIYYLKNWRNKI